MDSNRLNFVYYRVVVTGSGFAALAAPSDGFVDNLNTLLYAAADGTYPTTLDLSRAKERANARWEEIMVQTQMILTPVMVTAIEKTGSPNADTAPATLAFTIMYDREPYVYTPNTENVPSGVETLTGEAAVKRMVARALMIEKSTNRDIYSPVMLDGNPQGLMYEDITTGALTTSLTDAEAAISVTRVTGV
jgi:hypothetical protein